MKWRKIAELKDKYAPNLLLCAPELVDLDCNEHGIGLGYWQDDGLLWDMALSQDECDKRDRSKDYGCFMACKWSMTNDEWMHVACTPTHFIELKGPVLSVFQRSRGNK